MTAAPLPDLPDDPWIPQEPPPAEHEHDPSDDPGCPSPWDLFWDSRPVLRHLHDFARARRVAPWAVLGVAMARVIVATPYTIGLPPLRGGVASLNLFVGLVGASGSGKGAAAAVAAEALRVGAVETHTIGSGEGIAHGYMHRVRSGVEWNDEHHAVLFDVPEIDTLTALGDRRGATLLPQLRQAWSGERLGFGYADPTKRLMIPAHRYRMALVAGIQPLRAEALLGDADGGTPQRFIWLPTADPDAPDHAPPCPEPRRWRLPTNPGGLVIDPDVSSTTWPMPVCSTAAAEVDAAALRSARGEGDPLDGHALLARLKISAALALLDERLEVTEDDWRLAGAVTACSDATRRRVQAALTRRTAATGRARAEADADRTIVVADRVTEASLQRVCRAIHRQLTRTPGEWATSGDLRKGLASRDRGDFDAALARLTEAGQIETDHTDRDNQGHGGRGTRHRTKETR